ncbi:MAG: hypothetical protein ACE5EH_05795 [Gammaproteobacteria bacterium]
MFRFLFGMVIGVVMGFWMGMNYGKDQPLFYSPFEDETLTEKMMRKGGDALEKSGDQLLDKFKNE